MTKSDEIAWILQNIEVDLADAILLGKVEAYIEQLEDNLWSRSSISEDINIPTTVGSGETTTSY